MTAEAQSMRYRVTGMDCASCAAKIETAVRRIEGVSDVAVSVTNGTLTVSHGEGFTASQVKRQVRGLGYGIAGEGDRASDTPRSAEGRCGPTARPSSPSPAAAH